MTTTARIAATTASDTYVTTIASARNFAAMNLSASDQAIDIQIMNSTGGYESLRYLDESGRPRAAQLTYHNNTITISAGDVRFVKPETAKAVELVEYT